MDNFIVSARKYRPQTFDTVVGQKSITNTLKNAIRNNQLAQAFLFCGPRGVGKTTCARILAKTINCDNLSPAGEACDKCSSCTSFNENASFNIYELDGASNNSVDEIRNLVDKVRIPPQMGKYKVYIIDEVHMLSASAFNAFLKTLEEPPAYAKFILATTEKHKIIPTILSRCQIFDFKRITVDDIASHLQFVAASEGIKAEENALHIIAQKADGAMRDALSIFDQLVSFAGHNLTYETVLENLNVLDYEYFFSITGHILSGDISSTLLTINEILDKGFDGQHFLIGFGEHIRNLLVCKDPVTVKLLETAPTIRNRYLEQASQCPVDFLLKVLDLNNKCDLNYKISNNKRLHLELALMQMCIILKDAQTLTEETPKPKPVKQSPPPVEKKTPDPIPEQPVKKEEPPKPKESKPFTGTFSIKDAGSGAKKEPETKEPEVEEEPAGYTAATSFSLDQLETAWDTFSESLRQEMPHLSTTLKKHRPVLKEDFLIEFCVDNKILAEELERKRNELLGFLITQLNNNQIHLQIIVPDHPVGVKPYTDREKFARMAEKNPAVQELREQMDLEI
ncbi:MAG: DNA polymerase III subunit gamma/tau [Bacteroidetes bacterium]|nr:DNA polymerase III subunit gamma/tau [Bacteroidota bacterium]